MMFCERERDDFNFYGRHIFTDNIYFEINGILVVSSVSADYLENIGAVWFKCS